MTPTASRMGRLGVEHHIQWSLGDETECSAASPRDWLTAQVATRLGRLNRFELVLRARRQALSVLARDGFTARAQFSMGIELDLPCWDNGLSAAFLAGRVFEPMPISILRSVIRPGAIFIDGGAHVGLYAVAAAKLMQGSGTVIAFEPDPRNFPILQRNILRNKVQSTILAECLALSDFDGETEMWISDDISTCSSLVSMGLPLHRSIRVRATCLDSFLSSKQVTRIDLLKLDLEGAEPACLRGARTSIQMTENLLIELNAPRLQAQGLNPQDVLRDFIACGDFTQAVLLDEILQHAIKWSGGIELDSLLDATGFVNVLLSRNGDMLSLDAMGA